MRERPAAHLRGNFLGRVDVELVAFLKLARLAGHANDRWCRLDTAINLSPSPTTGCRIDRRPGLLAMDSAFTKAMTAAIAAGLEHPPAPAISTVACTVRPILVRPE